MSNTLINCNIHLEQLAENLSSIGAEVERISCNEVHISINKSHYTISILSAPFVSLIKRISVAGTSPNDVQKSVKAINDLSMFVRADYDIVSSTVTLSSAVFAGTTAALISAIYPYMSVIENAEAVMTGMIL